MKDKAFEGDNLIWDEIQKLVQQWNVRTIIETGTEYGATAHKLSQIGLPTFTIESNLGLYEQAWMGLACRGIVPLFGESQYLIPALLRSLPDQRHLFFLDAHDNLGTAIRDELMAIRLNCVWNPVVVIHDCKVPDKDFGHDVYTDGTELTMDYFKDLLTWPHKFYYNTEAQGAKRGVLYITP